MDRVYIDQMPVRTPEYGSVIITVQDGKVVRVDVTETTLYNKKS